MVKRAPVLTLWAAVVAKVLGFEHDEVLTLGRAVAGLNAYSKGVSLRLFQPPLRTARFKQLSKSCVTCYISSVFRSPKMFRYAFYILNRGASLPPVIISPESPSRPIIR